MPDNSSQPPSPREEGVPSNEDSTKPLSGGLSSSDQPEVEETPDGLEPGTLDSRG